MSEVAPGTLDLVRRFLNTASFSAGGDGLQGPDRLPEWCAAEGLPCAGLPDDLDRLRRFREALRKTAFANAGHGDSVESWRALEPYASQSALRLALGGGSPQLVAAGEGVDLAISAILVCVYDAVRTGHWQRFKACRADDCRWAFYDRSKNGSGTWCSMAECGNRMKARRRRRRGSHADHVDKVAVKNA